MILYGWVAVESELTGIRNHDDISSQLFKQEEDFILRNGGNPPSLNGDNHDDDKDDKHDNSIDAKLNPRSTAPATNPPTRHSIAPSPPPTFNRPTVVPRPPTPLQDVPTAKPTTTRVPTSTSSSNIASISHRPPLRFCKKSGVRHNNVTLGLLYQCQGSSYQSFGKKLAQLAQETSLALDHAEESGSADNSSHQSMWGRRDFPVPANRTVLVMGNSHVRQISKTIICQYSDRITNLQVTPPFFQQATSSYKSHNQEVFGVKFQNGARWISMTNTILAYSHEWQELILKENIWKMMGVDTTSSVGNAAVVDTVIMGKFTKYAEGKGSGFEQLLHREEDGYMYLQQSKRSKTGSKSNVTLDFAHIPPPTLVDVAQAFDSVPGGIIAVPMFGKSDKIRAKNERNEYEARVAASTLPSSKNATNIATTYTGINQHVSFINTRQFIDALGLECGSDDRTTIGSCHEAGYSQFPSKSTPGTQAKDPKPAAEMHRCAGAYGGHADLVAWSLVEELYRLNQ
jgi:hypothetical protein